MLITLLKIIFIFAFVKTCIGYWAIKKEFKDTWNGAQTMEMKKSRDLAKEWAEAHPYLANCQDFYYMIMRWLRVPMEMYSEVKWFIQRGIRGYSDRDVWNFDSYMNEIMSKAIKHLVDNAHGCPPQILEISEESHDSDLEKSMKMWHRILNEIVWLFETNKKIENDNLIYVPEEKIRDNTEEWFEQFNKPTKEEDKLFPDLPDKHFKVMTKEECKRYREAWILLQKYWFNLWD